MGHGRRDEPLAAGRSWTLLTTVHSATPTPTPPPGVLHPHATCTHTPYTPLPHLMTDPHCYMQLQHPFRILWADHGDALSWQYAGTGALKSGFTRTGKRTAAGLLDDGIKSAVRYYLNNYEDGHKQDALDLVSGAYRPRRVRRPLLHLVLSGTVLCWSNLLRTHLPDLFRLACPAVRLNWLRVVRYRHHVLRCRGRDLPRRPSPCRASS